MNQQVETKQKCPSCGSEDVHVLKSREHPEHDRICLGCMEEWQS